MHIDLIYMGVTRPSDPQTREHDVFLRPNDVTSGDSEESPQK